MTIINEKIVQNVLSIVVGNTGVIFFILRMILFEKARLSILSKFYYYSELMLTNKIHIRTGGLFAIMRKFTERK